MPAQQTPVELQPVKWQTSNMLAASFAQSGLAKWLSAVHNRSLKVCFRIRYVMSLYPQKHVLPHFDKTVQLILLWLQCDLRSTFEHKLLIPGTLEQWINQQREYFCLQIKEKSKTWPLFSPPFHCEQQKQNLLHKCLCNVSDVPEALCGLISKTKPIIVLWVVYGEWRKMMS